MEGWRRLLLAAVLAGALVAMTVHYGAVADDRDPYPTADELAADYEAHVGDPFYMWTRVTAVEDDTLYVRPQAEHPVSLRVVGAGAASSTAEDATPGDVVQVYGTLEPGRRVAAERVVVSEQTDRRRMFVVSGLAALLTAAAVRRRWTVDWSQLALVPRGERDG
jgi:hypothetical protein